MKNPKVSIIVPVYRTEKYLGRCLESLRNQSLKEIEIILVDDGSPDGCPQLCDKAAAEDSRIKVLHKANEGAGYARNFGMAAAEGEYVGFADSDDYVDKYMFERLYLAAKKYNAQLVMSGICFVGGNVFGKENEYYKDLYFEEDTFFEGEKGIKELMCGICGTLPNESRDSRYGMSACKNLYKREAAEKNNVRFLSEREILSEDALFMLDFAAAADRAVGIRGAFYYYCRNGESLSKSYNAERADRCVIFMYELEKRLAGKMPRDEYKVYLDRTVQALGRVLCSQEIMYAIENKIKYTDLRNRLKKICTTHEIAETLKKYPWYRLPPKQALFAFLMKHKLYFVV